MVLSGEGERLYQTGAGIQSRVEAESWRRDFDRWKKLAGEGLKAIFVGAAPVEEFANEAHLSSYNMSDSWKERHARWLSVCARAVNALVSFRERLVFAVDPSEPPGPTPATGGGKDVFVVHGQNETVKQSVARLLEKVVEPGVIVLAEQPDLGRTIIEKFEDYAAQVGYTVVLLTGDDEARKRGTDDELRPRARQNVILELGFFVGTLGRGHVALLYEEEVELPSDISGVLYLRLDAEGAWKTRLAGEMLEAGIALDAKAVIRG